MFLWSERLEDDQEYLMVNLNGLKNNFEFYNHNQQNLGSCWYNSICSAIVMAENPTIVSKIMCNEIKPIAQNGVDITDVTEFNELEIKQMQKLQELSKNNEVERAGKYEDEKHKHQLQRFNRQIVSEKVRKQIESNTKKYYKQLRALNYIPIIPELEKEKIGFNTALLNYIKITNIIQNSKRFYSLALNKKHSITHNSTPQIKNFLSDLLDKREKIKNYENNQVTI